jgi:hypothetical protein
MFKDETVIKHNTHQWDHVTKEGDFGDGFLNAIDCDEIMRQ